MCLASVPIESGPPIRIVGGTQVTSASTYPYQVSLRYNGAHICGGSIISTNVVLTAAHCILSTKASAFSIQAGIVSRQQQAGQIRGVSRIVVHQQYDSYTKRNDIALLVLNTPLQFN